jgi:hypothetical protein
MHAFTSRNTYSYLRFGAINHHQQIINLAVLFLSACCSIDNRSSASMKGLPYRAGRKITPDQISKPQVSFQVLHDRQR